MSEKGKKRERDVKVQCSKFLTQQELDDKVWQLEDEEDQFLEDVLELCTLMKTMCDRTELFKRNVTGIFSRLNSYLPFSTTTGYETEDEHYRMYGAEGSRRHWRNIVREQRLQAKALSAIDPKHVRIAAENHKILVKARIEYKIDDIIEEAFLIVEKIKLERMAKEMAEDAEITEDTEITEGTEDKGS